MNSVNKIVSDNPIQQIWKLLRLYLDAPSVCKEIRRIHNLKEAEQKQNVQKQATQIGYCIRQAEEYFRASTQVSLATRPVLLYYGAMSLSQALFLLKLDGKHSLDALRKVIKHNHHGLEAVRGLMGSIRPDCSVSEFFDSLKCTCYTKPPDPAAGAGGAEQPWGHLSLFYKSLGLGDFCLMPIVYRVHGLPSVLKETEALIGTDRKALDSLLGKQLNALTMLKSLPDMYALLKEVAIAPDLCRGSCQLNKVGHLKPGKLEVSELEKVDYDFHHYLDEFTGEAKVRLLGRYQARIPLLRIADELGSKVHLRIQVVVEPDKHSPTPYMVDAVSDLHGETFYLLRPEEYIVQPAAYLILLFCLGMLARYYPDVWMAVIDKNAQVAEVTDAFLNVAYRKFPNLILDQMRGRMHVAVHGALGD
jgi:hypothetical protein